MKNLRWYDKILFLLNSVFSAALVFSYLLPYIPPKVFALLSVLSLGVPLLIMINIVFLLYWFIRFKKQLLLPLIALLLGFNHLTSIYEISGSEEISPGAETISLLSYNVRQFNKYGWSERIDIPGEISEFLSKTNPDIVSMQEYSRDALYLGGSYPYKYIKLKNKNAYFGLAIFSKYKIINSGSLDFETKSNNNAIFADVVVGEDTLRIINVHFQSFSLKPDLGNLETEQSKKVFLGMGRTFVKQQYQMEEVLDLISRSPYTSIVMGDFNNTAYSYIYRELISAGFNDAYKEAGSGFGRSFDFDYFPLRIDYIMPAQSIETVAFETFEVPFSDHFPIRAVLKL
ncbi:MAG TPA: endonuclease/exonuclease/phosphatase family protein [Salinimicrobium sp.]|nr:endonuclease/exonuclease/phosphatase family protein [Salinimicrobium sp.]